MTTSVRVSRREFLRLSSAGFASMTCLPCTLRAGTIGERRLESDVLPWTPRVALVGIGTVGVDLLGRITPQLPGVDGIAINAGTLVEEAGAAGLRLALGLDLKRGLCFGRREVNTSAALAHRDAIAGALGDADLVLLIGSLGGHTVTATAPFVARLAREAGALTIAVVTKPFQFEGRGRVREADAGLRDLVAACESTLVVPGDRSIDVLGSHAPLRDLVDCRDEAVCGTVRAIVSAVRVPGRICVGFSDIRAVFLNCGVGAVGLGLSDGPHRAERSATSALTSPFLRDLDLAGVGGVFVHVAARKPDLVEIDRAATTVWRAFKDGTPIIVGDAADPHLGDTMRITLVAAGLPPRRES
jgi:cell division protein FtsZ